jgi:Spy/CpxP family protein refolding chaperone
MHAIVADPGKQPSSCVEEECEMKRVLQLALVVLVGAATLAVQAQDTEQKNRRGQRGQFGNRGGFGQGGGTLALLSQKSVQQELKLTDDQIKKAEELLQKQRSGAGLRDVPRDQIREKMQELAKANQAALAEILKPEQTKRLREIALQRQGPMAIANPQVAEALKLTEDQKEKIRAIQRESFEGLRTGGRGGNFEEIRAKMAERRKESSEKIQNLLTDEQKAKWKELLGAPFTGEIERPQRGTGNRPGADSPRRSRRPAPNAN